MTQQSCLSAPLRRQQREFLSVIIVSTGRPECLGETVASLKRQTMPADEIILSVADLQDVPPDLRQSSEVQIITGPRGSTLQRNTAIGCLHPASRIVSYVDDDVVLAADYFQRVREFFAARSDVAAFFGLVLADGGIDRIQANQRVAQGPKVRECPTFRETDGLYGCNMNVRRLILKDVRFDARLGGYAWLEDKDFGMRCRPFGKVGQYTGCRMVHLKVPGGRTSPCRYGFSQIMNPFYLWRQTRWPPLRMVLWFWSSRIAANAVGAVRPGRRAVRLSRLRGNWVALKLILRGRITPEYVLELP